MRLVVQARLSAVSLVIHHFGPGDLQKASQPPVDQRQAVHSENDLRDSLVNGEQLPVSQNVIFPSET